MVSLAGTQVVHLLSSLAGTLLSSQTKWKQVDPPMKVLAATAALSPAAALPPPPIHHHHPIDVLLLHHLVALVSHDVARAGCSYMSR